MHEVEPVVPALPDVDLDHVDGDSQGEADGCEGVFEAAGGITTVSDNEGGRHWL
jgi:hypothetical protein